MSTVTYFKQPGIHKTRGTVPLNGTEHPYQVTDLLWPKHVEAWISERLIGRTLHICCGKSRLGDVRLDLFEPDVDIIADMTRVPVADNSFDTVLIDPPYNARFQVNHDMLNELHRIARQRVIFQHWFLPVNSKGQFKKAHVFRLTELAYLPDPVDTRNTAFVLAMKDTKTGEYFIVEEDLTDDKVFDLVDACAWQGRTYFGRAQVLQVYDRGETASNESIGSV
jgi:hypothetical protein